MSINVNNLSFSYGENHVLEDVSFAALYGDFVSVIGPNGAGKTTLFKCLLGLLNAESGTIQIDGKDISKFSMRELSKHIAYIPQSHNPVFNYSVLDMVLMGTTAQIGMGASPGKKQVEVAMDALCNLGIDNLKDRGYRFISGGERQLVLIARAIAQQAKIMIMDEPTASLDFGNSINVMKTIRKLADSGYLIIQSTHDPNQAYLYSTQIMAMSKGKIVAYGKQNEIMDSKILSEIFRTDVEMISLKNDSLRIFVPAKEKEREEIKE